jgi:hypothetical protein
LTTASAPKGIGPVQKDAAYRSDRPVAGGGHDLDDLGPAALEHAAHPRERLVVAEVRRLIKQAPAHAGLGRHGNHPRHRRVRVARLEVGDRAAPSRVAQRTPTGSGTRSNAAQNAPCASAEQPLEARIPPAHRPCRPCSVAI